MDQREQQAVAASQPRLLTQAEQRPVVGVGCRVVSGYEEAARERHQAAQPHVAAGLLPSQAGQQRREQCSGLDEEAGARGGGQLQAQRLHGGYRAERGKGGEHGHKELCLLSTAQLLSAYPPTPSLPIIAPTRPATHLDGRGHEEPEAQLCGSNPCE